MAEELKLAETPMPVKLDLACGQTPKEGFEGVDFYAPEAKHKVDLWKFPLPWGDSSIEEIYCSHFLEHLPARAVEHRDMADAAAGHAAEWEKTWLGRDFLFAFMDECWRILKPGATMTVAVPCARSNRGFQDPTHRRFFVAETFLYFAAEWRALNKLDHYQVRCDFGVNVVPIVLTELTLRNQEVQARMFNESWNTVLDWYATLIVKK